MEEKILAKSVRSGKFKIFKIFTIGMLVVGLLILVCTLAMADAERKDVIDQIYFKNSEGYYRLAEWDFYSIPERYSFVDDSYSFPCYYYDNVYDLIGDLKEHNEHGEFSIYYYLDYFVSITGLIVHWFITLLGIIMLIITLGLSKCELIITNKNVQGKTFFGKKVMVPIDMISSYSIRPFLSTIAVASSSGYIKFRLIENLDEMTTALSSLINDRQDTIKNKQVEDVQKTNALEDLTKLKELLDANVITQEEFEMKKKQILGL